jgi:hypothetical protein
MTSRAFAGLLLAAALLAAPPASAQDSTAAKAELVPTGTPTLNLPSEGPPTLSPVRWPHREAGLDDAHGVTRPGAKGFTAHSRAGLPRR